MNGGPCSRRACLSALRRAGGELMRRPRVIALGVSKAPDGAGYRVCLYVSRMPEQAAARRALNAPVRIAPEAEAIPVEVRAIGVPCVHEDLGAAD